METRKEELLQLQSHIKEIDAEFTIILQHLQWDRKHLLQDSPKVVCKYNTNHRVAQESKESHEAQCRLAHNGYSNEDKMLPNPLDNNAKTLIQLNKDDIKQILTQASNGDPSFNKGTENVDIEPQTLDRLQSTYTGDERRAIYDAVVQAAPFCHDLSDLALLSEQGQEDTSKKQKSRLEILAELRDMKRRRTKYRVAAKTRNYSDVLRDVIKTQMEVYSDVKVEKSETSTSNDNYKYDFKYDSNKPHKPSKNDLLKSTSEFDNNHKRKREKSRNRYDEDRPSSSKKTRHYDEIDSSFKHKDHKDKRYNDDKRRDRHSSRESSRYDDRYNGDKLKDRMKEHRHSKKYDDGSSKDSRKYDRSNVYKHRREKHSYRNQRDEQYESKSYYHSKEYYESRQDKKKYSEYKKSMQ